MGRGASQDTPSHARAFYDEHQLDWTRGLAREIGCIRRSGTGLELASRLGLAYASLVR